MDRFVRAFYFMEHTHTYSAKDANSLLSRGWRLVSIVPRAGMFLYNLEVSKQAISREPFRLTIQLDLAILENSKMDILNLSVEETRQ